jgi:hypothetical protein
MVVLQFADQRCEINQAANFSRLINFIIIHNYYEKIATIM